MRQSSSPQAGFALLTVMIIVAVIAMIASQLVYQQQAGTQRSSFMLHQGQALSVNWGLETWVKKGLALDVQQNKVDHLQEQWATPLMAIPFEGGQISGRLFDAQSRLNLNNVMTGNETTQKHWQGVISRYATAFNRQQVSRTEPVSLSSLPDGFADKVTDWVDVNDEPEMQGAESDRYLLMQPAYRTANGPMVHLHEIKLLEGMQNLSFQQWQQLEQSLIALPVMTTVNVNTADQATLMALADWMTEPLVKAWFLEREKEPAESTDTFRTFMQQATGFMWQEIENDLSDAIISVNSDYFLLQAEIQYGDAQQTVYALFDRSAGQQVRLIQRWLGATNSH